VDAGGEAQGPGAGVEVIRRVDASLLAASHWAAPSLAIALLVLAAATSAIRDDVAAVYHATGLDYSTLRKSTAFNGFPLDAVAQGLDAYLPSGEPVALGPRLTASNFLRQRVTEVIYPRLVAARAEHQLELGEDSNGVQLVAAENALSIVLLGGVPKAAAATGSRSSADALSAGALLLASITVFGLGLAAMLAIGERDLKRQPAMAVLVYAAFALALLYACTSWVQWPLAHFAAIVVATVGYVVTACLLAKRRLALPELAGVIRTPENAIAAGFVVYLFTRALVWPVSLWDGRSIWLFQAHRLFERGLLTRAELTAPDTLWSHPDYPLLMPAWLALFAGTGGVFSERQAALGLALLLTAVFLVLWTLARECLGRITGGAFVLALAAATDHLNGGAYADGLLVFMLASATLALLGGHETLAFVLLGAGSLTKGEGLVLGVVLAVCLAWTSLRRAPWQAAVFAPALVHKAWTAWLGADSLLKGKSPHDVLVDVPSRLWKALTLAPSLLDSDGYTRARGLLWAGPAAVLAIVVVVAITRARPSAPVLKLACAATLTAVFAFGSVSLLPGAIDWFVATALDRLLLHATMLFCLAALVSARRDLVAHDFDHLGHP